MFTVEHRINRTLVERIEAVRVRGSEQVDSIGDYEVRFFHYKLGYFKCGYIEHRYGDGALVLSRKLTEYVHSTLAEKHPDVYPFRQES